MEPVTHLLTGACLSRAGLNRRAAYATLTMVIAAEFPDIDTLWSVRGPIEGFQHHRGITHTFLGLPFEAALLVLGVYGLHRWRVARARSKARTIATTTATANTRVLPFPLHYVQGQDDGEKRATANASAKSLTIAPVRWGVLYGLALVGLLSHLLLDYTNNYGLRPFFPFDDRWYAASIVFIFDPVMFVLLLGALIMPSLFGLVSAEVGAKKQPFRGRGWAMAALLGVVGWWGLRTVEHQRAMQMAMAQSLVAPEESVATAPGSENPDPGHPDSTGGSRQAPGNPDSLAGAVAPVEAVPVYLPVRGALASPDLLSPFRWSAVMDFGPVYQLAEIDTRGGMVAMGETTYPKPGQTAAVLAAERSRLGRVYMDWSPMPFVEVTKADSELAQTHVPEGEGHGAPGLEMDKIVTFRDPRFLGGRLRDTERQPLVGVVELDAGNHVVREMMDGRVEP